MLDFTDGELQAALVAALHYQQRKRDALHTFRATSAEGSSPQGTLFSHDETILSDSRQLVSKLTKAVLRRQLTAVTASDGERAAGAQALWEGLRELLPTARRLGESPEPFGSPPNLPAPANTTDIAGVLQTLVDRLAR